MANEYFTTDDVKRLVGLKTTDTVDDALIGDVGLKGSRQVDNDLAGHLGDIPITATPIVEDVKGAANYYAAYLFQIVKHNNDSANMMKETYELTLEGIKNRLVATVTTRTQRQSATKDWITDPLKNDPLFD